MGSFFKENWIWIVAPLVLMLVGVVVLILMEGDSGDGEFRYPVF